MADLIARRFKLSSERYGLNKRWAPLDVTQFRVPPRAGDQLALF